MPIEFFDSPEGRKVGQSFDSPTVYLDHWANRLFSEDRTLHYQSVAALLRKCGTLLVSNISMAELGAASDPRHVIAAEKFLERCLPHLFLTDFRLDEMLARERKELRLAKSSMVIPIAKCFSRRNEGISAFLADLEYFDPRSQSPTPRR